MPNKDILDSQGKTTNITNSADLTLEKKDGNKETVQSNVAKVGVINDFIKKTGVYRPSTKDILWTVEINNSKINFTNPVITDTLEGGLALDTTSVKLDNVNSTINTDFTYDSSSRVFTFNKSPEDNKTHKLTFITTIDQTKLQEAFNKAITFNNKIDLSVNSLSYYYNSPGVGVGTDGKGEAISKKALNYNKQTKEVTWQITVNTIGLSIDNPIVTEILGINQAYVEGSAEDESGNKLIVNKVINTENEYQIPLGININSSKTIILKTKVTNDDIIYGNENLNVSNSCKLTGTNIGTYTANNISQNVDSTLIRKSGNYNYANRHITWTIDVNKSETPIKDVKILDSILSGQEFLKDTFKVIRKSGNIDDTSITTNVGSKLNYTPKDSSNLEKGGDIIYDFGDINDSYEITFETQIPNDSEFSENKDKVVTNEAKLTTSETAKEIKASNTVTIKNYLVYKDSQYTQGNDFITWDIYMNKNNVKLKGFKIVDNIQEGLQVDMDSIKLYEVELTGDDYKTIKNKTEVPASEYTSNYSADTRNLEVNYSSSTTKAYLLEFDTIAKNSGAFSNSVSLNGNSTIYTSEKKGVNISFSDDIYGGGASGTSGSVILTKVDKDDNSKKLNGAVFELIKDGKVVQTSEPTVNGVTKFTRLKFGVDYHIKEIKAPTGYVLDSNNDTLVNITQDKVTPINNIKKLDFNNEKIKKNIELIKRDSNGSPLKGAEFKLYLANDTFLSDPKAAAVSDDNGIVLFKNIAVDPSKNVDYVIKETKAPDGYVTYENPITVTITPSGDNGDIVNADLYVITDNSVEKNIKLLKTSKEGEKLADATFTLYKKGEDTNPIQSVKSDKDGIVEFKNVDYGDYTIKETMAPQGYDPSTDVINVDKTDFITTDQTIEKGTVVNTKTKLRKIIELYKESENGSRLKDGIFAIYNEADTNFENPLFTTVSDSNGLVRFTNIKEGDYKIKEIKAPKGYELSDTVIRVKESDFAVTGDIVKTNPYKVINKEIIKSIELYKQDSKGNPLEGAIFTLYKEDDSNFQNPLSTGTSDINGLVRFTNVKFGNYKIKEITAPSGYSLSNTIIHINEVNFNTADEAIKSEPYNVVNYVKSSHSRGGGGSSKDPEPTNTPEENAPTKDPIKDLEPTEKPEEKNPNENSKEVNTTTVETTTNVTNVEESTKPVNGIIEFKTTASEGSVFTIYDENGNAVKSAIVGKDGVVTFLGLDDEEVYYAKETGASERDINKAKLPQAGSMVDTAVLIILGALLIIAGSIYNVRKKSHN